MAQADLEVNRKTRSVFVRHWIDIGHLSFRSVNGRITVRGNLERVFGQKEPLTPTLVDSIFKEIRRIPGAKGVHAYMDNWSNEGGVWHQVGAKQAEKDRRSSESQSGQDTYVIDDK